MCVYMQALALAQGDVGKHQGPDESPIQLATVMGHQTDLHLTDLLVVAPAL